MKRAFAAAVLVPASSAAAAAAPSVDSQLWSELDATYPMGADWSATAIATTRLGNNLPNPTLTAAGVQIDDRIGSWTATGVGYYVSIRDAQSGARTTIWLPAAALTYEIGEEAVALSDRNRIERLEGLPGSPARYRNRASISWHLPGEHAWMTAFVADEVFYDFSKDRWTRNRAQAGLQFQLTTDTRLQTFYMRQNSTSGATRRLDVLGVTLQLAIR